MTELTPEHVLADLFQEDAFVKKVPKRQATMTMDRLRDAGFEVRSTWPPSPSSAESVEAVARRLAQWIKYSWAGLGSGSIVDRGYPEWAGHAYQGGQEDLRRLAAELIALSAPAQAEPERIAELQYEAGMYKSLYENAIAAQPQEAGSAMREATMLAVSAVSKVVSSRDDLGNVHFVLLSDAIIAALSRPHQSPQESEQ